MHTIQIPVECPCCQGRNIKKNGFNGNRKQKYLCKTCGRNFIGDHALTYKGCHSRMKKRVPHMLADHCGIRQIARLQGISRNTVCAILRSSDFRTTPQQQEYDCLKVDEFWIFIQRKDNKRWLIY
ncbi:MAG: IS1 family transposase, partial [Neisseria sp.]|nr:IS1 family transposase [Neisseria sp.]